MTPQFVLTEAELKARGVTQAVVRSIFSAGETSIGAERDRRESGFGREVQIVAALLEKNFPEPEIIEIFENTPQGIGFSLTKIRSREACFEKLLAAARKAFKTKSRSKIAAGYVSGGEQLPPDYEFDNNGAVWLSTAATSEGGKPKRILVSNSALRITGIRENIESGELSLTIAYGYLGETRSVTITPNRCARRGRSSARLPGAARRSIPTTPGFSSRISQFTNSTSATSFRARK